MVDYSDCEFVGVDLLSDLGVSLALNGRIQDQVILLVCGPLTEDFGNDSRRTQWPIAYFHRWANPAVPRGTEIGRPIWWFGASGCGGRTRGDGYPQPHPAEVRRAGPVDSTAAKSNRRPVPAYSARTIALKRWQAALSSPTFTEDLSSLVRVRRRHCSSRRPTWWSEVVDHLASNIPTISSQFRCSSVSAFVPKRSNPETPESWMTLKKAVAQSLKM